MDISRRAFLGALAAIPVATMLPASSPVVEQSVPLVYVGEQWLNNESWHIVMPPENLGWPYPLYEGLPQRLPVVCGVLDDELMPPKPPKPYYRISEDDFYTYTLVS